jgi:hypothetical protein
METGFHAGNGEFMNRISRGLLASALLLFSLFSFAGCGDDDGRDVFVFTQLSDINSDGYISSEINPVTGLPTVFPATVTRSIQIGVNASAVEYRGFLVFPLTGLPVTAIVQFAEIEVFVTSVPFLENVPILMELVNFPPPLVGSDFFRFPPEPFLPPILGRALFSFLPSDAVIDPVTGLPPPVRIEVTSLVQQAQSMALPDFQLRLLLDPDLSVNIPRLSILDDGDPSTAPLLYVEYF